jgi:hypothetical protein
MYEVAQCEKNTRFAGRALSQFVDVRAGGLWRADFQCDCAPRATVS